MARDWWEMKIRPHLSREYPNASTYSLQSWHWALPAVSVNVPSAQSRQDWAFEPGWWYPGWQGKHASTPRALE